MSLHDDIAAQRRIVDTATRELRRLLTVAVVMRDGTFCHYCGESTLLGSSGPLGRTLDHVIPQAFGGKDELDNLVLACRSCNSKKGKQVAQSLLCSSCRPPSREGSQL